MAALFIGTPRTTKGAAVVRLKAGAWVIKCRGVVDSLLHLKLGDSGIPLAEGEHKLALDQPCEAIVLLLNRGSEDYVSVIAESQRCQ
jgi:hypothetical protein